MSSERAAIEKGLFEAFVASLVAAVETMAGAPPEAEWETSGEPAVSGALCWKQPLPPLEGCAWAVIPEAGSLAAGRHLLAGAGIEEAPGGERKAAYLEVLNQALSGLAQAATARLGREVTCADGAESSETPPPASWAAIRLTLGELPVTLAIGLEAGVIGPLLAARQKELEEAGPGAAAPASHAGETALAPLAAAAGGDGVTAAKGSKTFDLLLDVELPVCVSFGHAQVPLKDVLKLTTGSIVELDRAIVEPVDVVVNNRVIARGEVVVVEGNFGVRIQKVVSRNERLRSLQ